MSKTSSFFISLAALVLSIAAIVMCVVCCNKNKANNVEEALMNNPEIVIKAMQKYEQNMREQASAEAEKLVAANIDELNNNANTPFVGPKDAKVTVVEFFDYSCGYCHRLFPELKKVMDANPDVKFVFKPLAFVSAVSKDAAKATLAANKQGKFIELHNALFDVKGMLTNEKIKSVAEEQGLDMVKFDSDLNSDEVAQELNAISQLSNKIQVNGVPVLFINGKMVQTLSGNDIQNAINSNN